MTGLAATASSGFRFLVHSRLPFCCLMWISWTGVLTVLINLIMASAFASIMIYALELVPHRIGLVGGIFYGLNFGMGGLQLLSSEVWQIGSALKRSISFCAFLPLAGLLTVFLPRTTDDRTKRPAKRNV